MMNVEKVAKLCEALSLKEKKGPLKVLQEGKTSVGEKLLALLLTGKLLPIKPVNREAFILSRQCFLVIRDFRSTRRIGHTVSGCSTKASTNGPKDFNSLYSPWMKASSPTKSGPSRGKKKDSRYYGRSGTEDFNDTNHANHVENRSLALPALLGNGDEDKAIIRGIQASKRDRGDRGYVDLCRYLKDSSTLGN
ncbi:hypothetical protein Ddye_029436 [Dipteronia dyeriana]|uniref:Uncharacterized protein n=1 Tax=Dipteronia dyeriana TaxID=168575 RepID=A0AAD9TEF1_9ROSI|nr:hypothetical protein Ddye_029436 [Dipteronia dyeriana]